MIAIYKLFKEGTLDENNNEKDYQKWVYLKWEKETTDIEHSLGILDKLRSLESKLAQVIKNIKKRLDNFEDKVFFGIWKADDIIIKWEKRKLESALEEQIALAKDIQKLESDLFRLLNVA
ncbi:Oidioi.mRNA.OKI2018_I69.XSR.g13775.t1.cds [Oikopleura dioica]|uniref:Oidioi.mRNA.OKI2018_I69.XSR.g13775.t1.cds n=1 Tax=Oikopleura dioica TaxID=34765 RepID=A0ABN7S9K8_OIKDI|nr:Oidioi.mRNA.OKI2018_I69.XSR.g13775.t1.cds [Oikopleura dioica]